MGDYTPPERKMLLCAERILFPTPRFAGILQAAGKKTFPSAIAYSVRKSRLIQEVLFQFLKCPHPLTRIYYGRQKASIIKDFPFPFRAMGPKTLDSAGPVFNGCDLQALSYIYNPLIIQDKLRYQQRFRLVFINYECAGILRKASGGEQQGLDSCEISHDLYLNQGTASECLSREIVSSVEKLLKSVHINDIAAEVGITRRGWHLIELVRPPLAWPISGGLVNRFDFISRMIEANKL